MKKLLVAIGVTLVVVASLALGYKLSANRKSGGQAGDAAAAGQSPAPADIDRLLAPIALYPDALLAQMLMCAADPPGVASLNRFLQAHTTLKGTELQDAAVKDQFEPSFVAMALFPQVVSMMAADLDWTTRLGQTFASHRTAVFDAIQRLRAQAQNVGTLKDTPQQSVETQTTSTGQQVIVIEPANPQVIYVPQDNPEVVYVQAPATTTVVVEQDNTANVVAAGLIGFTAGIAIGAAVNNSYYYGPYGWHGGAYMYNDAWDNYYDHREDAREDWMDHREDLVEDRGDRARDAQEQRTDRRENQGEQRTDRRENQGEQRTERRETQTSGRTDRQQTRQETRPASQAQGGQQRTNTRAASSGYESRGYSQSGGGAVTQDRSGTRSDAFSGYSSGQSTRSASSRGQSSRSSSSSSSSSRSRSGGGGGGGGGGGRRR